jgi:hypothetical protein
MNKPYWRWIIWLAALLLAFVLAHWGLGGWLPQANNASQQAEHLPCVDILSDCGDHTTSIRFSQIPSKMRPFQVTVQHAGAKQIYVDFVMPGMAMGLNRYRMLWQDNVWQAKVILPACVQGRSDWQMWVTIDYQDGSSSKTQWIDFVAGP